MKADREALSDRDTSAALEAHRGAAPGLTERMAYDVCGACGGLLGDDATGGLSCRGCAARAEVARLRAEIERLRAALTKIERLKAKWDAPLTHPVGDMSDPAYAGAAAWAAVGSEAHKIAETALAADEVTR